METLEDLFTGPRPAFKGLCIADLLDDSIPTEQEGVEHALNNMISAPFRMPSPSFSGIPSSNGPKVLVRPSLRKARRTKFDFPFCWYSCSALLISS